MDYKFRTKPYKHQENIFNKIKDMPNYALLMEQGTGKTKVIIDNFSYLYKKGNIDAVLVVAPNGVHRNWINDEVPKHMPEDIKYKSMFWDNSKSKTKKKVIKNKETDKTKTRLNNDLISFEIHL